MTQFDQTDKPRWYERWYGIVLLTIAGISLLGIVGTALGGDPTPAEVMAQVGDTTTTSEATTTTLAPTTTTTVVTTTTQAPVTTTTLYELTDADLEMVFLTVIKEYSDGQPYLTMYDLLGEDSVVELAKAICGDLDAGDPVEGIALALLLSHESNEHGSRDFWTTDEFSQDLGAIMGAGVEAFCPQHSNQVQEWANS